MYDKLNNFKHISPHKSDSNRSDIYGDINLMYYVAPRRQCFWKGGGINIIFP